VPLGQISTINVHKINVCHDASKEANVATTRTPNSKILQLNVGIPKCKAHLVSWKSFFFYSFKHYDLQKPFNVGDRLIKS
jgi:hypothetical protein